MSLSKEAVYDTYNQHVKPVFGVDLKEEQADAITSICCGKHVLVVLPTGFGKSLIFTSLPLIMDKVGYPYPTSQTGIYDWWVVGLG